MTFTEQPPEMWRGFARRIDAPMLKEVLTTLPANPRAYVCGPTQMVETVAELLVDAGLDPTRISAERFGSTA